MYFWGQPIEAFFGDIPGAIQHKPLVMFHLYKALGQVFQNMVTFMNSVVKDSLNHLVHIKSSVLIIIIFFFWTKNCSVFMYNLRSH